MAKPIHIALGSTTSKPGDVSGNLQQIARFARQAASDHADLLLTPEMSASGYGSYPEVLATAEVAGDGPIYRTLAGIARMTGVVICAGFVEQSAAKRYLAHYIVYPDDRFLVQRKHRVTPAERPLDTLLPLVHRDANDYIGQPLGGLQFQCFDVRGVRCAITICADSGIDNLQDVLAEHGVELQLNPAGAGGRREDRVVTADLYTEEGREKYARLLEMVFFPVPTTSISTCLKYGRALAAVNQCGHDGREMYHLGHGFIVTPMGEVAAVMHGIPNIDRMRPMYAHAQIDLHERLVAPEAASARIAK